jgi:two-component system chemotaxis response regulator CheB
MEPRVIVVGASAGGFSAIRKLLSRLDPSLTSPIFIVLHTGDRSPGHLASVLEKSSRLPVRFAGDGQFEPGTVYVAPSGHHLVLERSAMRLVEGPRENLARPAIDVLFRSAARAHGNRTIGVVLTGMLDDGTAGLFYIKRHGGVTIVQDPAEAEYPSMPATALAHVPIDYKLPLLEIGATLSRLAKELAVEVTKYAEASGPILLRR